MTAAEWVASVLGTLGLIGGAIGFFRSRAAAASAKESEDEARRASDRSIVAAETAANAQLRIAEAFEARLGGANVNPPVAAGPRRARWRVDKVGEHRYRVTNVGDADALQVRLVPVNEEAARLFHVSERPNLEPGDGLDFGAMRTMGGPQVDAIRVEWIDDDGQHDVEKRII